MDLDALYQEIILDHYKRPHHAGLREPYDAETHHVNPTCGDEITLRVHLSDGPAGVTVDDVSYDAEGCSISQASASVMTDLVIGRSVPEAICPASNRRRTRPSHAGWVQTKTTSAFTTPAVHD